MRTQVGIVGAGPAGLLLAHLLRRASIDCVVVENRTRQHVEERVRAGVLEQGTVDLLTASGVGERLRRQGLVHHGIELRFAGQSHRIALTDLTGRSITVYGQQEVVKDLIAARLADGGEIYFEVSDVKLTGLDSTAPALRFAHQGRVHAVDCDFIAGCDGFHGVSRASIAAGALAGVSPRYPFARVGVLPAPPPPFPPVLLSDHQKSLLLLNLPSPPDTTPIPHGGSRQGPLPRSH